MSGRHVSTLATTFIASPLGESLATHLASASLLKMRASLIKTAVLQESGPIPGHPPQSHSRTRLRRYANGSTGGKSSSPHQDAIFHFARIHSHWLSNSYLKAGGRCASRRRGRTAMEVQSLFCRPLGRTSPESHPRQRRPPTVLPTTRGWLFAFARFKFVKTQPESAECALGDYAFADSVAPFTGHCLRVREPSIQMTVSNSKRAEPLAFLDEWFCPGKMQVCHRLHLPLFVRIEVCQRAAQFSWYLSSPSHSYRSQSSRVAMFKRTPPSSASRARARIEVLLLRNSSKKDFSLPAFAHEPTDSLSKRSDVLRLAQEDVRSSFPGLGLKGSSGKDANWCSRAMDELASAADKL